MGAPKEPVTSNESVWKRPGWIMAITSLLGLILTTPQEIGDYLGKMQDIKIAEQKTKALEIGNVESKQDQEFKIVSNTLAQQGPERVFVLRYLAATLDDEQAKEWAKEEVKRLDDIAGIQDKLSQTQQEIETIRTSGEVITKELEKELASLTTELYKKNSELAQLKQKAGLNPGKLPEYLSVIDIEFDWSLNDKMERATIDIQTAFFDEFKMFVSQGINNKTIVFRGEAPSSFTVDHGAIFKSARVIEIYDSRKAFLATGRNITYRCEPIDEKMVCVRLLKHDEIYPEMRFPSSKIKEDLPQ